MQHKSTRLFEPDFERMFCPQSVAFIGASANNPTGGSSFIKRYKNMGFKGRMYPVNPKASEIQGLKCYPSVGSIPETVDFAIFSVPARFVPQTLIECADAGVRNIHIFTAGFKETGEPEGIELEKRIKEIADERGLAIVGPNGMGPYVPKSGIGTWDAPSESGPVAAICQSGTMSFDCTDRGCEVGLRFSKIVSIGNATVLDSTDFLEYFADDPETKAIVMYLEGVSDGRKLTRLVKEINPRKPVAIMKGGLTESGARAVASHTGSLAGSEAVWNAFFKQTGAVRADTPEELMDVSMAFLYMPPLRGKRMALIGAGGGLSVSSADAFAREGLVVPPFSKETQSKLSEFIPSAGSSVRNPLDTPVVFRNASDLEKTLGTIAADPAIDGILIFLSVDVKSQFDFNSPKQVEENYRSIINFAKDNPLRKPLAVVHQLRGYGNAVEAERTRRQALLVESKVAVFPSFRRAALALSKFADYHEFMRQQD